MIVMIYTVKRIDEDLDFGCEERSADTPIMAVVTLIDPSGEELCVKAEDTMLYKREINEGAQVYFDENNQLEKVLDRDWTKRCNTKTVDDLTFTFRSGSAHEYHRWHPCRGI